MPPLFPMNQEKAARPFRDGITEKTYGASRIVSPIGFTKTIKIMPTRKMICPLIATFYLAL